jgi:hypothetical protein
MRKWENIYKSQKHTSVWPWTDLVSLVNKYTKYKLIKNLSFLEIGTGYGANIDFLNKNNNIYYGNEESLSAYKYIKNKYNKRNIIINNGNFLDINYEHHKFDCIVDRASITHNSFKDIKRIFNLSYKYIKPDGHLISTYLFSKHCSVFKKYSHLNKNSITNINTGFLKDLGIVTFFNKKDLLNLISNKYEILHIEHNQKTIYLPKKEIISWWNIVLQKNAI